jgi:hypothetical protein
MYIMNSTGNNNCFIGATATNFTRSVVDSSETNYTGTTAYFTGATAGRDCLRYTSNNSVVYDSKTGLCYSSFHNGVPLWNFSQTGTTR